MLSGDDSIWESFPLTLRTQEGAGRYINAFRAPFQELPSLSPQQVYTLWPAPSWSYLWHWGERLLREASPWTSRSSACQDGPTSFRIQQSAYRLFHPGWPVIWTPNQLPCSSCLRLLWEWGSAATAATQDHVVCVREPLSWLPPCRGARLFNRLEHMKRPPLQGVLLILELLQEAYLDMGRLLQALP